MVQTVYKLPFRLIGIPVHLDLTFLLALPLLAWLIGTQMDRFAVVGVDLIEDESNQRGLADTRGADDGHLVAALKQEVEVIADHDVGLARLHEALGQPLDAEDVAARGLFHLEANPRSLDVRFLELVGLELGELLLARLHLARA